MGYEEELLLRIVGFEPQGIWEAGLAAKELQDLGLREYVRCFR